LDGIEADQIQFGDLAYCRELSFVHDSKKECMSVAAGRFFSRALPGIGMKKANASFLPETKINRFI
jgi:hypothetical protein